MSKISSLRKRIDRDYPLDLYCVKYEQLVECRLRSDFFRTEDGVNTNGKDFADKEIESLEKKSKQIEIELKFIETKL